MLRQSPQSQKKGSGYENVQLVGVSKELCQEISRSVQPPETPQPLFMTNGVAGLCRPFQGEGNSGDGKHQASFVGSKAETEEANRGPSSLFGYSERSGTWKLNHV